MSTATLGSMTITLTGEKMKTLNIVMFILSLSTSVTALAVTEHTCSVELTKVSVDKTTGELSFEDPIDCGSGVLKSNNTTENSGPASDELSLSSCEIKVSIVELGGVPSDKTISMVKTNKSEIVGQTMFGGISPGADLNINEGNLPKSFELGFQDSKGVYSMLCVQKTKTR